MSETAVLTTKAHVFQIDPATRKNWVPASKAAVPVSILYDSATRRHRIVSSESGKTLINAAIVATTKVNKTSAVFGQFSDRGTVFGIGFANEVEITKFVAKVDEAAKECAAAKAAAPVPGGSSEAVDAAPAKSPPAKKADDPDDDTKAADGSPPAKAPKPGSATNITGGVTVAAPSATAVSAAAPTPATTSPANDTEETALLKYENERLKVALKTSSENAKQWEKELQTLKNNNARLKTALEESHSNVEEWKVQLATWKDQSATLKSRVQELEEARSGSAALQAQVDAAQEEAARAREALQASTTQLSKAQQSNAQLEAQVAALTAQLAESKASQERSVARLSEWKDLFAAKLSELDDLHTDFGKLVSA